jgi:hypothetical protein
MVDLGKDTALADDNKIFAKHIKNDIKKLKELISQFEDINEPVMLREIETLKKEIPIKEKIGKIISSKPRKLTVDYEYEQEEDYHKLAAERQKILIDDEMFAMNMKLENKQRTYKIQKEYNQENKDMLKLKEEDLKRYEVE